MNKIFAFYKTWYILSSKSQVDCRNRCNNIFYILQTCQHSNARPHLCPTPQYTHTHKTHQSKTRQRQFVDHYKLSVLYHDLTLTRDELLSRSLMHEIQPPMWKPDSPWRVVVLPTAAILAPENRKQKHILLPYCRAHIIITRTCRLVWWQCVIIPCRAFLCKIISL